MEHNAGKSPQTLADLLEPSVRTFRKHHGERDPWARAPWQYRVAAGLSYLPVGSAPGNVYDWKRLRGYIPWLKDS
jgi:hypothetical protein